MTREQQIRQIEESWKSDRWQGAERTYTAADVVKLRGSIVVEQTLALMGGRTKKECRECGEHIQEQAESYIYECERCFGRKEE